VVIFSNSQPPVRVFKPRQEYKHIRKEKNERKRRKKSEWVERKVYVCHLQHRGHSSGGAAARLPGRYHFLAHFQGLLVSTAVIRRVLVQLLSVPCCQAVSLLCLACSPPSQMSLLACNCSRCCWRCRCSPYSFQTQACRCCHSWVINTTCFPAFLIYF